jgi:hypothetical protein
MADFFPEFTQLWRNSTYTSIDPKQPLYLPEAKLSPSLEVPEELEQQLHPPSQPQVQIILLPSAAVSHIRRAQNRT